MAKCPQCLQPLPARRTLVVFFNGNASIECPTCAVKLKQDKTRMLPYYLGVVGVAAVLGSGLAFARTTWIDAFIFLGVWVFVAAIVFVKASRFIVR